LNKDVFAQHSFLKQRLNNYQHNYQKNDGKCIPIGSIKECNKAKALNQYIHTT